MNFGTNLGKMSWWEPCKPYWKFLAQCSYKISYKILQVQQTVKSPVLTSNDGTFQKAAEFG